MNGRSVAPPQNCRLNEKLDSIVLDNSISALASPYRSVRVPECVIEPRGCDVLLT